MNTAEVEVESNKTDILCEDSFNSTGFSYEAFNEKSEAAKGPSLGQPISTMGVDVSEVQYPVLGRFIGIVAKLDSMSVNKRRYSAKFWRSVLNRPSTIQLFKSGHAIGIFEHPNTHEIFTKSGQFTMRHPMYGGFIMKRVWIEGNNIMGEGYILNTSLGRTIATYMLARDKNGNPLIELCMSARGYSMNDYFDEHGIDHMNPDDYIFQGFDIVLKPGVKGTTAKMESLMNSFLVESESDAGLPKSKYESESLDDTLLNMTSSVGKEYQNKVQSRLRESMITELDLKTIH